MKSTEVSGSSAHADPRTPSPVDPSSNAPASSTGADAAHPASTHAWPLLALGALALWMALFRVIGKYTWGHGRLTFWMLIAVVALLSQGPRLARALRRYEPPRILAALLGAALLALVVDLGLGLVEELERPKNANWAIDIAANTYVAGDAFLEDKNPYEERAQTWHRLRPGPNVTVEHGEVRLYGQRYTYGFPYFPAMFLSYLPGRWLIDGYHSMRVENALLLLLNLGGLGLLLRRAPLALRLLAGVAYLGVPVLQEELFRFAITDLVIATYALFAFVALSYERWVLAGVLFGLAQACKLLPGPLLVLPVLVWLWPRRALWKVAAAYVGVSLALILPFLLVDPELFVSSTILFYLTYHAVGDDTSLWFYLPEAAQPVFRVVGYLATLAIVGSMRRQRSRDLGAPLTAAFVAYLVFVAFNNMTHLNYIWGVFSLGAAALALVVRDQVPSLAVGCPTRPPEPAGPSAFASAEPAP